jgi:hypothetical protein
MHKVTAAVACAVFVGVMMHGARSDELSPTYPIPDVVQQAATVYEAEVRGVVGMQRHFTTVIHAGPIHHTEHSDSGFLMRDGTFTRIKYYQIADDGQPFTPEQTAIRESQTNRDWSEGKIFFKEPYDERFLGDYQYDVTTMCTGCQEGVVAVNFTSDIKDNQHGSGTMWVDAAGHVTKVVFSPNKMPPHANYGTVTEIASEVMPGVWYVTQIQATYKGRLLLLTGGATFTATFDHFHRFDRVGDANEALDDGSI